MSDTSHVSVVVSAGHALAITLAMFVKVNPGQRLGALANMILFSDPQRSNLTPFSGSEYSASLEAFKSAQSKMLLTSHAKPLSADLIESQGVASWKRKFWHVSQVATEAFEQLANPTGVSCSWRPCLCPCVRLSASVERTGSTNSAEQLPITPAITSSTHMLFLRCCSASSRCRRPLDKCLGSAQGS